MSRKKKKAINRKREKLFSNLGTMLSDCGKLIFGGVVIDGIMSRNFQLSSLITGGAFMAVGLMILGLLFSSEYIKNKE